MSIQNQQKRSTRGNPTELEPLNPDINKVLRKPTTEQSVPMQSQDPPIDQRMSS